MSDPNFGPFLDTNDIPSTQSLFENISCLTPISDSHNPAKEAFDSAKAMCTGSLPPRMHSVVVSAVRECVRPDYRQYMVEQVPRWAERGLWHQEQRLVPAGSTASYDGLIRLYYYVCQLDQQMADDDIRKRASLVLLHHQYEELSSHKASIEVFNGQSGLTGPVGAMRRLQWTGFCPTYIPSGTHATQSIKRLFEPLSITVNGMGSGGRY